MFRNLKKKTKKISIEKIVNLNFIYLFFFWLVQFFLTFKTLISLNLQKKLAKNLHIWVHLKE